MVHVTSTDAFEHPCTVPRMNADFAFSTTTALSECSKRYANVYVKYTSEELLSGHR
jgi:hypothetical protein